MNELKNLGNESKYLFEYSSEMLESFDNKHLENDTMVKFNCPEFTSLCPITGQPDFATIYISYIPDEKMLESKSLKLYLFSFRNHGSFHADCVTIILNDLTALLQPRYIEVLGKFLPRGGISIDPWCNYGQPGTKYKDMAEDRLKNYNINTERFNNR
jgi:7-cyano-7-deazaguanine reductase